MSATGLVPQEHVVFTEFDAGEGVLVDLNTKKYFQLNETAVVVSVDTVACRRVSPGIVETMTNW